VRFEFAVAAVVIAGIAVGAALPYDALPSFGAFAFGSATTVDAKPADADPSSFHFKLVDLNPLRLIFDYEQHEIATDANRDLFFQSAPILRPDFSWVAGMQSPYSRGFDSRTNIEGLQAEIRERSLHQQDIMNYVQSGGRGPSPTFP
jgi:hypothetical protein